MASNFFNKASLVMVPDAPIDGKLPSVKPEDRSGDFIFSRGSNLAATRINKDGLIEKGRENLLTYSNDFSNADWEKTGIASVSGGQVGYDGSNNAYLITSSTLTTNHYLRQSASTQSGVQTYSIYAKGNGYDVQLRATGVGGTTNWVSFNLVSGSVGTSGAGIIESKMTSLGNGWYRCSAAFNDSGSPFIGIYMVDDADTAGSGPSYTGDGISGMFLQDAQVELGLVATEYIGTTTATVQKGILENLPRLDYSGGASCPSLLLEPQRTNLIWFSEWFGAWDSSSTFLTHKDGISPSGYKDATKLYIPADNANVYVRIQFYNVANQTHIGSIFLKKVDGDEVRLRLSGSAPNIEASAIFNLSNGTYRDAVGSVTPSIENYGNGWYRCSVGDLGGATVATPSFRIDALGTGYAPTVYVWGGQVEVGSYPTSYIPTYGTSQTRSGEICGDAGDASTFNSTEGVLYFEVSGFENDLSDRYISISDGTLNNAIKIFYYQDGGTTFFRKNVNGAQTTIVTTSAINKSELAKIAVKYNSTNFDIFSNGVKISTNLDSNSFPIGTLNEINFSNAAGINQPFYGKTKQLIYFPTALTEDECIALTTI
jgi:hypothetical protein